MRYHADTVTVFARTTEIRGKKLIIDGKTFPWRIGKDVSITLTGRGMDVFAHGEDEAALTVVVDSDQADFFNIVAGVDNE